MSPTEILSRLRIQPFQPLRFHLSDGSSYDVRHPEMALVTRSLVTIVTLVGKDGVPDKTIHCDPLHITRMEPLNGGEATGRSPKRKRAG